MTLSGYRNAALFVSALALSPALPAAANEGLNRQALQVAEYIATNGVSVIPTSDGGAMIVIETQFPNGRVPELHVGLAKSGAGRVDAQLGRLQRVTGIQVFRAPASIDVSEYDELVIWDPHASKRVGAAPLG